MWDVRMEEYGDVWQGMHPPPAWGGISEKFLLGGEEIFILLGGGVRLLGGGRSFEVKIKTA